MKTLALLAFLLVLCGCAVPPARTEQPLAAYERENAEGLRLSEQGRYIGAFEHFTEAVRLAPQIARVHNNLGYACLMLGKTREAIVAFETALALDPDYAKARRNLETARAREQAAQPLATQPRAVVAPVETSAAGNLIRLAPNVYELRPASRPAQPARPPAAPSRALRLEVTNGNGARGMARRVARRLARPGLTTARVINERSFRLELTEIRYREGQAGAAAALGALLAVTPRLVQSDRMSADVDLRIVLGRDLRATHVAKAELR